MYSNYFNPEIETMGRAEIEALQLERLQKTVRHCMKNEFYRKKFAEAGITPDDIKTLADVRRLPFTTKSDLRETYPFGMSCVPLKECVRLHSSSGTTGNPTVILHTKLDLDEWANQVARNLWMVGLRPEDVFQNSSGYGMFTGGLACCCRKLPPSDQVHQGLRHDGHPCRPIVYHTPLRGDEGAGR